MEKKETRRADKKKNIAKVAKAIIQDPLATQREIAKKAWVSNWTAHNMKKEVEQTWAKDDRIVWLVEDDFEIVRIAQGIIKDKLLNEEEVAKMKVTDVSTVAKDSAARYTIFWGKATDENGHIDIKNATPEQLLSIIQSK